MTYEAQLPASMSKLIEHKGNNNWLNIDQLYGL